MKRQNQELLNITRFRRLREDRYRPVRLDSLVCRYVTEIAPVQGRFTRVIEVWESLLPRELSKHCRLAGISAGTLDILVSSPVYLYEINLCRDELLQQLQSRCPKARITGIRLSVGSVGNDYQQT
ncbi:MAG: DUF721 domain-containing protein [Planctomycetota bacterium]